MRFSAALCAIFALSSLCDARAQGSTSPFEIKNPGREFLFMGDNRTTYVFRGRELQRHQDGAASPATDSLRPLPKTKVTDAAGILPDQAEAQLATIVGEFETKTNLELFIVTTPSEAFEDVAWALLDTLRFGTLSGDQVVLVFSSDPERLTALFGSGLVLNHGRAVLTKQGNEALLNSADGPLPDQVISRTKALVSLLTSDPTISDGATARQLLYGPGSQSAGDEPAAAEPQDDAASANIPGAESAAAADDEVQDSQLWELASFVLVAILVPALIIAIAILGSMAYRKKTAKMNPAARTGPKEATPLSLGATGIPMRRVKSPPPAPHFADAPAVDTTPRGSVMFEAPRAEPPANRHLPPAGAQEPDPTAASLSFDAPSPGRQAPSNYRTKTPSRGLEEITFAPGEREKINELLAALRMLQDADDDTRAEVLDLIRTLVTEIKQLATQLQEGELTPG